VLSEYKMSSASVAIHQPDATLEDLIDVVEGNRWVFASSEQASWVG
jgi:ribosome-interacting GTPase 1